MTDAHGKVWRSDLNALGWATRAYDPTNSSTAYTYDVLGRVKSLTNRRGERIDFAYDSLGRLLSKTGTNVMAAYFEYDSLGRFTVGRNAVSVDTIFTNNQTGWTDSVVTRVGGRRFRIKYRPDANQRLDSVTIAQDGASPIAFLPRKHFWSSSTGLLDSIKVNGRRFKYRRNTEFLVDSLTYPSAVRLGVSYTSVHQVKSLSFGNAYLDSLLKRTYGYDSLGHVESEVKPITSTSEHRRTFGYDRLGELTSLQLAQAQETCTTPPNVPEGDYGDICELEATPYKTYGFHYDSVYNLRREVDSTASVTTSATLVSPNRQSAWGSLSYGYDADGNRTSQTGGGGSAVAYHWTADGLLDTVTVGTVKLAYDYNAFGQLVRRSRAGTVERHFLWDRGQLLAELNGTAGARIAEFAYAPGVDAPLAMVAGSDTASMRYFHRDALGNVAALTDQSGTVVQRLDYGPWGALEQITGTVADTNRLRWKGLLWEGDSTKLYYVRARWYDPVSRRFISEDPSGLAGGINQYAFARNDPVGQSDPTGMRECRPMFIDGHCGQGGHTTTLGFAGQAFGWGSGDRVDAVLAEASSSARLYFARARAQQVTWCPSGTSGTPPDCISNATGQRVYGSCPNVSIAEYRMGQLAIAHTLLSGLEEGFIMMLDGSWVNVRELGYRNLEDRLIGRPPAGSLTLVHSHPSGRGISEDDVYSARVTWVRVVSAGVGTNRYGSANPSIEPGVSCDMPRN